MYAIFIIFKFWSKPAILTCLQFSKIQLFLFFSFLNISSFPDLHFVKVTSDSFFFPLPDRSINLFTNLCYVVFCVYLFG